MIQCKTTGNEAALLGRKMGGDKNNLDISTVQKAMLVQITVLARVSLMCPNTLQVFTSAHILCTKQTALSLGDGKNKNYFQ